MRRYQIFVSSTFLDLKKERAAVLESILQMKCFPAGMELFPSASMNQFEYIKKSLMIRIIIYLSSADVMEMLQQDLAIQSRNLIMLSQRTFQF